MLIKRFALARMSAGHRLATALLLLIPLLLAVAATLVAAPLQWILAGVAAFSALIYMAVFLYARPSRFELGGDALVIVWPLRAISIHKSVIGAARMVSSTDLRQEYGASVRVRRGGLFGGFGRLATERTTFSMWISRGDGMVVVDIKGGRPLLITPARPDRFIAAVEDMGNGIL